MVIICPNCASENVIRPMADSNEFICQDCGEDFTNQDAEDLIDEDEFDEKFNNSESSFIDLDPETALRIAREANKEKE